MKPFFDPDRDVFAKDKGEHFAGILALAYLLLFFLNVPTTLLVCFLVACTFELGQWDIARQDAALHTNPADLSSPFLPGYGFGLLDIAAGMAGALAMVLIRTVL